MQNMQGKKITVEQLFRESRVITLGRRSFYFTIMLLICANPSTPLCEQRESVSHESYMLSRFSAEHSLSVSVAPPARREIERERETVVERAPQFCFILFY